MPTKKKKVCILIPAYNEATVIFDVVSSLKKVMASSSYLFDIVIINDGSIDSTRDEAKRSGAIVIDHILNSGQGAALLTGLRYVQKNKYDIAATMDGDGQHLPEDVLKGIDKLQKENYDFLIGSRLIDSTGMSRLKILGNKGLSLITYLLFGTKSTDSQSGLRILSRKSIDNLRWKSVGYEFASEMLWRANQLKLRIADYPIKAVYTSYSVSRGQNNWNAINIVKTLVKRRLVELLG